MGQNHNRNRVSDAIREFFGWDPDTTDVSAVSQRIYEGIVSSGIELAGHGPRHILGDLVVDIHPADDVALEPFRVPLERSIAQSLERDASRRNIRMIGPLHIRYVPTEGARRGRPAVRAGGAREDASTHRPLFMTPDLTGWLTDTTEAMTETMSGTHGRLVPVTGSGDVIMTSGTVGRGTAANSRIASAKVSNVHAQVDFSTTDCQVRDLGSTNGTFIDDDRLAPGTVATLRTDQTVRFADLEFLYIAANGRA